MPNNADTEQLFNLLDNLTDEFDWREENALAESHEGEGITRETEWVQ